MANLSEHVALLSLLALLGGLLFSLLFLLRKFRSVLLEYHSLQKKVKEEQSEMKALQEEILESSKYAAVGQLAAGVAHELNTPLGAVLTMVQSLPSLVKDEKAKERLTIIEEGVSRCKEIVQKLLIFSRKSREMEKEGMTFSRFVRGPVQVNDLIRETVQLLSHQYSLDQLNVTMNLQEVPPIRANANQLTQVITNLFTNSYDAIQPVRSAGSEATRAAYSAEMKISTFPEKDQVVIEWQDNGTGIPQKNLEHIFEPFFSTKSIGQGTGLGLAITREIVLKHRGTIQVSSKEGEGALFTLRFPVQTNPS